MHAPGSLSKGSCSRRTSSLNLGPYVLFSGLYSNFHECRLTSNAFNFATFLGGSTVLSLSGLSFVNSSKSLNHRASVSVHLPFLTISYIDDVSSAGFCGPFLPPYFSNRHFLNSYHRIGTDKKVGNNPRVTPKAIDAVLVEGE